MLSFFESNRQHGRRDFLRVGGLALGGLTLPDLLAARARAATVNPAVKNKSVIFLFMHGGPSQTETFDPKMSAPAGVRSATGEIATRIPGVTFGGTFEKLAPLADKFSIVRSFKTGNGNHDIKPVVCNDTVGANIGSLYARVAGTNDPETGMPRNAALYPRAVDPETMPQILNFGDFASTGTLGNAYAPFIPGGGGSLQESMKLAIPRERLDDRKSLLSTLDRIQRSADASGELTGLDRFQQQAFDTIIGGVADAFDLSNEDATTIAKYDTAPLVRPEQISKAWKNYERYVDNAKSLGKLLLLARRLCESGCGFVTISTNFVWDMHSDQNNAGVEEGMQYMGVPFDHAVSAFLQDVEARGLSDDILLVCCGEMGRTPKINARGGRDHWGGLSPLLLSGGGLQSGQVIGQSTRDASEPATEPVTIKNLVATIMHTLLDVGHVRTMTNVPADVARVITGPEPIRELMS
ncbi:MAG: DUF1501 domain-containing protein [Planctomycetes bacterium]|nr:DUF1501 domain-containing protein [Planctomycetota bacterium]